MKVFLLDVGDEIYGDCILVQGGGKTILIDGSHPGDFRQRGATPSIPDQIADLLATSRPFSIDLLVVTHCHVDHIGCLPTLIGDGTIRAKWALVADPDLGYPPGDANGGADDNDTVMAKAVAGLREEPRADFRSDAELDQFLTDALNLEGRYRQMLDALSRAGTRVVRFLGADDTQSPELLRALVAEFAPLGLQIIGPTQNHLLLCTQALADFGAAATTAARQARRGDVAGAADPASLYRLLSGRSTGVDAALPDDVTRFIDRPGRGAALNDQSIVLKLDDGGGAVLLTGDMQLAKPEIAGLRPLMGRLLATIGAAGPYALVKLPHHASYNGFNDDVLAALAATKSFVISTGRGDPGHPDKGVLSLLQEHRADLKWGRTDKNGILSVTVEGGLATIDPASGRLNDASPNLADFLPPRSVAETTAPTPLATVPRPTTTATVTGGADGIVEVTARIPHVATRVTITVDVEPKLTAVDSARPRSMTSVANVAADRSWGPVGGGRPVPPLIFVTDVDALRANIGVAEANSAVAAIRASGHALVASAQGADPAAPVRNAHRTRAANGIVILGGYDVVRSLVFDTLPADLRRALGRATDDPDDFLVWSDQIYGDVDGDKLADLPVSRIPDARSADLVRRCLCGTPPPRRPERFGLRNDARPFADGVFRAISGARNMAICEPTTPDSVVAAEVDSDCIYLMMHGSDTDGTCYWGERRRGGIVEGLRVANVPETVGGTVFAGCCWGALSVRTPASRYRSGDPVQSLTPEQSIALTFLLRGARAFVGCTGAHYSPYDTDPRADLGYFGGPIHRAFWSHLLAGDPPALALFNAKVDFIRDMPHGRRTTEEQAIEYKILREFTCLGLGW